LSGAKRFATLQGHGARTLLVDIVGSRGVPSSHDDVTPSATLAASNQQEDVSTFSVARRPGFKHDVA
jgi:hypothetical protein